MKGSSMFKDIYIVEYVDSEGMRHWVDRDGDVSMDAVEMRHADAEAARQKFIDTACDVVVAGIMAGYERVEINLAEDER